MEATRSGDGSAELISLFIRRLCVDNVVILLSYISWGESPIRDSKAYFVMMMVHFFYGLRKSHHYLDGFFKHFSAKMVKWNNEMESSWCYH